MIERCKRRDVLDVFPTDDSRSNGAIGGGDVGGEAVAREKQNVLRDAAAAVPELLPSVPWIFWVCNDEMTLYRMRLI